MPSIDMYYNSCVFACSIHWMLTHYFVFSCTRIHHLLITFWYFQMEDNSICFGPHLTRSTALQPEKKEVIYLRLHEIILFRGFFIYIHVCFCIDFALQNSILLWLWIDETKNSIKMKKTKNESKTLKSIYSHLRPILPKITRIKWWKSKSVKANGKSQPRQINK